MESISKAEMITAVKNNVSIQKYFDAILIPDMPDYFSDYSVDFEMRPTVKCPIHGEDEPSFRYYEETKTYYCFGCGSGGDVIHLHAEYMNKVKGIKTSESQSALFLYNYFIRGTETANSIKIGKIEKTVSIEDRVAEMRLKADIKEADELIRISNWLSIEEKSQLYNKVDNIELMNKAELIDAKKSREYLLENVISKLKKRA